MKSLSEQLSELGFIKTHCTRWVYQKNKSSIVVEIFTELTPKPYVYENNASIIYVGVKEEAVLELKNIKSPDEVIIKIVELLDRIKTNTRAGGKKNESSVEGV